MPTAPDGEAARSDPSEDAAQRSDGAAPTSSSADIAPSVMMLFGEYGSYAQTTTITTGGTTKSSSSSGDISNTAMHEWFGLGVRAVFDTGAPGGAAR